MTIRAAIAAAEARVLAKVPDAVVGRVVLSRADALTLADADTVERMALGGAVIDGRTYGTSRYLDAGTGVLLDRQGLPMGTVEISNAGALT